MRDNQMDRGSKSAASATGCVAAWPQPKQAPEADLLLERGDDAHWIVSMLSPAAHDWAERDLCCALRKCFTGQMRLDMMSADRLLKQAHAKGFKTQFVGGSGKDIF